MSSSVIKYYLRENTLSAWALRILYTKPIKGQSFVRNDSITVKTLKFQHKLAELGLSIGMELDYLKNTSDQCSIA